MFSRVRYSIIISINRAFSKTMMKLLNIAAGYVREKAFVTVHSAINKATGCLLFIFPLTPAVIDLKYSGAAICAAATIAAVYEGYLIRAGRTA